MVDEGEHLLKDVCEQGAFMLSDIQNVTLMCISVNIQVGLKTHLNIFTRLSLHRLIHLCV